MKIDELIKLASQRLTRLNGQRATAESEGDLVAIDEVDALILETENTLEKLRSLE
jgi:hypothetical protein